MTGTSTLTIPLLATPGQTYLANYRAKQALVTRKTSFVATAIVLVLSSLSLACFANAFNAEQNKNGRLLVTPFSAVAFGVVAFVYQVRALSLDKKILELSSPPDAFVLNDAIDAWKVEVTTRASNAQSPERNTALHRAIIFGCASAASTVSLLSFGIALTISGNQHAATVVLTNVYTIVLSTFFGIRAIQDLRGPLSTTVELGAFIPQEKRSKTLTATLKSRNLTLRSTALPVYDAARTTGNNSDAQATVAHFEIDQDF